MRCGSGGVHGAQNRYERFADTVLANVQQHSLHGVVVKCKLSRDDMNEVWLTASKVSPQAMAADEGRLDDGRACVGGTCASAAPRVSPDDPDLVAYWRFDEGTGFTVHDVTCA